MCFNSAFVILMKEGSLNKVEIFTPLHSVQNNTFETAPSVYYPIISYPVSGYQMLPHQLPLRCRHQRKCLCCRPQQLRAAR